VNAGGHLGAKEALETIALVAAAEFSIDVEHHFSARPGETASKAPRGDEVKPRVDRR